MEHILCKPKGSGLYEQNLLSQWRQDVKPESWAENNPLVKAVLSIHLWKKKPFLHTPRLPTPCTWAFKHTYTHCTDTHLHTPPGTLCLNLTSVHWCPPTIPFCPFCIRVWRRLYVCCVLLRCVCSAGSMCVCICLFICKCVCVSLTQQILCSILVVVCVVWEMIDLGTHTSLQAWRTTERKRRGGWGRGEKVDKKWRHKERGSETIDTESGGRREQQRPKLYVSVYVWQSHIDNRPPPLCMAMYS